MNKNINGVMLTKTRLVHVIIGLWSAFYIAMVQDQIDQTQTENLELQ